MPKTQERVLALPVDTCEQFRDGFTSRDDISLEDITREGEWTFLPRDKAETDERFRHLGTYAVLRSQGKIFRYRRGSSGTESRLHGLYSVGVGGHINEDDIDIVDDYSSDSSMPTWVESIWDAAKREVREEMNVERNFSCGIEFLGWLSLSDSPVNRVHLGVVFAIDLPEPVAAREDCLAEGEWIPYAELVASDLGGMEDWSRVLVESGVVQLKSKPLVYPASYYDSDGDETTILFSNATYVGQWLGHGVTVLRERSKADEPFVTGRVVGFCFKGKASEIRKDNE